MRKWEGLEVLVDSVLINHISHWLVILFDWLICVSSWVSVQCFSESSIKAFHCPVNSTLHLTSLPLHFTRECCWSRLDREYSEAELKLHHHSYAYSKNKYPQWFVYTQWEYFPKTFNWIHFLNGLNRKWSDTNPERDEQVSLYSIYIRYE